MLTDYTFYRSPNTIKMAILPVVLMLTLLHTYSASHVTLTSGAYVIHNGILHAVDDYMGILLDFSPITDFKTVASDIETQFQELQQITERKNCKLTPGHLLSDLMSEINSQLELVSEPISKRKKRAWPAVIVGGLSALFSISTQIQILYLQNKIKDITKMQDNLKLEIVKTTESLKLSHELITNLRNELESLKLLVNNTTQEITECLNEIHLAVILTNMKINVQQAIQGIRAYINSIISASNKQVTADILPLNILTDILHNETQKYEPIFPRDKTYLYYPFLHAELTTEGLLITLPLHSSRQYDYYTFVPHPTCVQNNSIILEPSKTELLIDLTSHHHFEEHKSTLDKCQSHFTTTICNSHDLTESNSLTNTCLYTLLHTASSAASCLFSASTALDIIATRIQDYTIVHNPEMKRITLVCNNNSTNTEVCDLVVASDCYIKGPGIEIKPIKKVKISMRKPTSRYVTVFSHQIKRKDDNDITFWFYIIIGTLTGTLIVLIITMTMKLNQNTSKKRIIHAIK